MILLKKFFFSYYIVVYWILFFFCVRRRYIFDNFSIFLVLSSRQIFRWLSVSWHSMIVRPEARVEECTCGLHVWAVGSTLPIFWFFTPAYTPSLGVLLYHGSNIRPTRAKHIILIFLFWEWKLTDRKIKKKTRNIDIYSEISCFSHLIKNSAHLMQHNK